MKILIFETGSPPCPMNDKHGRYPLMFARFIAPYLPNAKFSTCSLINGDKIPKKDDFDGFVILGSPYGVYDQIDWIDPLIKYVQQVAETKKPQIGICFGHQLIAKAMGGYVAKSPKGWGIGCHSYHIENENILALENDEALNLLASHQDQVIEKPDNAKVIAKSSFTPNAILHYEAENILTTQPHPEFSKDFAIELIASRRGTKFTEAEADEALKSMDKNLHTSAIGEMISNHFKGLKS